MGRNGYMHKDVEEALADWMRCRNIKAAGERVNDILSRAEGRSPADVVKHPLPEWRELQAANTKLVLEKREIKARAIALLMKVTEEIESL
jgi:hypothetical protein